MNGGGDASKGVAYWMAEGRGCDAGARGCDSSCGVVNDCGDGEIQA